MEKLAKYKPLIILLMVCLTIYVILQIGSWRFFEKPNEFGDTAGWINGVFSALAFAGVIYAIFMQREELELQREELRETRGELSAQREEFQTQNDTLKRQRFENTFFNMLQLQQQITDNITFSYIVNKENFGWQHSNTIPRYSEVKMECTGREVFRTSFEEAPHDLSDEESVYGMRGMLKEKGMQGYEDYFTPTYFDHYFRHMYRIIKFIDTSDLIKDDDRYQYATLVRAQLSRYELAWLYYNGLSVYGRDKFKPLIEKYSLLQNLRPELLVDGLKLDTEYSDNAFNHI